jgi:hypothetical protein
VLARTQSHRASYEPWLLLSTGHERGGGAGFTSDLNLNCRKQRRAGYRHAQG